MKDKFFALLVLVAQVFQVRRDAHIQLLKTQVEMLRKRVPGNRVVLDPAERKRLMELGAEVGHDVEHTLPIVSLKTYKRWLLEERRGVTPKKAGRPSLAQETCDLILRLARENVRWGTRRILGELKKLKTFVGRGSIRRVMEAEGLDPEPRGNGHRMPDTLWQKFLAAHLNSMVACDFLSKTVITPLGRKTAFMLMFIHLESRKVFLSPATYEPNGAWAAQQARNVGMWLDDNGVEQRFIIRDRDTKFGDAFDAAFKARGVQIVKTPIAAPEANSFAESWIGGMKRECLNHFMCFSLGHLDYIAQSFVRFYNEHRPHQNKGNQPLRLVGQSPSESPSSGPVECKAFLGGLLKHYYRRAA